MARKHKRTSRFDRRVESYLEAWEQNPDDLYKKFVMYSLLHIEEYVRWAVVFMIPFIIGCLMAMKH